jgi:hypothetical protein
VLQSLTPKSFFIVIASWYLAFVRIGHVAQSVSDGLRAGRPRFDFQDGQVIFLYNMASRQAQELAQPLIQWVPGLSARGKAVRGVKLNTHLHLVLRPRMVDLNLHSSYRFMAECLIKHRDNLTFIGPM